MQSGDAQVRDFLGTGRSVPDDASRSANALPARIGQRTTLRGQDHATRVPLKQHTPSVASSRRT